MKKIMIAMMLLALIALIAGCDGNSGNSAPAEPAVQGELPTEIVGLYRSPDHITTDDDRQVYLSITFDPDGGFEGLMMPYACIVVPGYPYECEVQQGDNPLSVVGYVNWDTMTGVLNMIETVNLAQRKVPYHIRVIQEDVGFSMEIQNEHQQWDGYGTIILPFNEI